MKKIIKMLICCSLLLICVLGLIACGGDENNSSSSSLPSTPTKPATPTAVSIKLEGEKTVCLTDFSLGDYEIVVKMSDNTTNRVILTSKHLSADDLALLETVGTHTITITYEGLTTEYTFNLADGSIFLISEGEITGVKSGVQVSNSLIIPSVIDGEVITGIANEAFKRYPLESVVIADSIQSIGESAFQECMSLTSVTMGEGVRVIGPAAFFSCQWLKSIVIPESVETILSDAFNRCYSLENIVIPNGVKKIYNCAFKDCRSLTSITIGQGVESVYEKAFAGCTALTEINFNAKAMDDLIISDNVFVDAGFATSGIKVTFGENVTNIPAYLFYAYNIGEENLLSVSPNITSVIFESNINCERIGEYAFYKCTTLNSITIPESVTNIRESAFEECESLNSITIPSGIKNIGASAFCGCRGLKEINFNATAIEYVYLDIFGDTGTYALDGIKVIVGKNVTKIPALLFGCESSNPEQSSAGITSVVFEENSVCESIGAGAFYMCVRLKSIKIPSSVTKIGDEAFSWCWSLENLIVDSENTVYHSKNNCLIETKSKTLIAGSKNSEIPNDGSVENIESHAFAGCAYLTSINIPNSVKKIGWYAFDGCERLINVVFEDKNGWYYASSNDYTGGTSISVNNSSANATYLKSTYFLKHWYKIDN